jgi:nucleoside-diphosphate-sugar epimerase
VDAALAAEVGVLVYPSFAPVYADGGARWLSVGDPVAPTAVLRSTLVAEEEVARFAAAGARGVALRMAGVYGPHSPATRDVLALARRGVSAFADPPTPTSRWCGTRTPRRHWSRRPSCPGCRVTSTSPTTSP